MRLDNCFSVSWTLTVLLSTTDTIASRNTGPICSVRNMQQDNERSLKSSHTNGATPLGDMFGICQIKLHWKCHILNNFIIWILKINNIMCQKMKHQKILIWENFQLCILWTLCVVTIVNSFFKWFIWKDKRHYCECDVPIRDTSNWLQIKKSFLR